MVGQDCAKHAWPPETCPVGVATGEAVNTVETVSLRSYLRGLKKGTYVSQCLALITIPQGQLVSDKTDTNGLDSSQ